MEEQRPSVRLTRVVSWTLVLLAGVAAVAPLVPPGVDAEARPTAFSAAGAMETIEDLAKVPHPMGSPEIVGVRSDIIDRLEAMGLEPELQSIDAPDYFGKPDGTVEVVNVMARIPGTASTKAVAVIGHYDTDPATPGANDDASAVAVALETARAIQAGPSLRNDVILLLTDGEEPAPRFGSTAFVADHPWAGDIGFVINLETIGTGGPSTIIEVSGPGRWVLDVYSEAAPHPAAFSFLTTTNELIGGSNTDFAQFRDAGISGLDFAYLHGSTIYHTPADTPDRVSLNSLQHHGSNTLALTRQFAGLDLKQANETSQEVFFTIGRYSVVRYPASASMPLVVLAGVVLAAATRRRQAWRRLGRSAVAATVTMLTVAVVAVGVWTVLAGRRNTMGLTESYLYLAGLLVMTVGIGAVTARIGQGRNAWEPEPAGVVTVWWALAVLTGLTAPGIGYLFLWPALAGALALLWQSRSTSRWGQVACLGLVAGTTLVLLIPAIDIFYQLAQPRPGNLDSQILSVIFIPALLLSLVVELLRAFHGEVVDGPTRPASVHEKPTATRLSAPA